MSQYFARSPSVIDRQIGDEVFLVHEELGTIQNLDPIGAAVWRQLAEPNSIDDVVAVLQSAFPEVEKDEISRAVTTLFAALQENQLIHPVLDEGR